MLTHIGQGDVLVCLNCGKPIVLTNKTFTLDCSAEYIECPNCKAKYDVQVYHARGSKILGKEVEIKNEWKEDDPVEIRYYGKLVISTYKDLVSWHRGRSDTLRFATYEELIEAWEREKLRSKDG